MTGRVPTGQALAVPATPANAVDGPAGFDPSRCSHLTHSPKGICCLCREQHQPLTGYSDDELAVLERDFWADWNAA